MSDAWVEVLGNRTPGGRTYYWHRYHEEVRWDAPKGVRVVWVMERHPASKRVYYWNKDTHESVWTLPVGKTAQDSSQRSGRWVLSKRSGNDIATAPAEGGQDVEGAARKGPAAGGAQCGKQRGQLPSLGRLLLEHAASLPGVRDCTDQVPTLLPGEEDAHLLLLECNESLGFDQLLPKELLVATPAEAPCAEPGYVVVDIGDSPAAADTAVDRLARCWWALAQASPRFATLVFATELCVGAEASTLEEVEEAFATKHRRAALRAPAPLVFAAMRSSRCSSGSSSSSTVSGTVPSWTTESASAGPVAATAAPEQQAGGSPKRSGHGRQRAKFGDYGSGSMADEVGGGASASQAVPPKTPSLSAVKTEVQLVARVAAYLKEGPREVQELAATFAVCFNSVVRANPNSPYSSEKKNDGSFKRWLVAQGFQAGPLFERNKALVALPTGKKPVCTETEQGVQDVGHFNPPYGLGTPEARKLRDEVLKHLSKQGTVDMGALRQVNSFGERFNCIFFQRSKVNDGSWKRWLASLPNLEVVVDPRHAPFHRNCPTAVRWRQP